MASAHTKRAALDSAARGYKAPANAINIRPKKTFRQPSIRAISDRRPNRRPAIAEPLVLRIVELDDAAAWIAARFDPEAQRLADFNDLGGVLFLIVLLCLGQARVAVDHRERLQGIGERHQLFSDAGRDLIGQAEIGRNFPSFDRSPVALARCGRERQRPHNEKGGKLSHTRRLVVRVGHVAKFLEVNSVSLLFVDDSTLDESSDESSVRLTLSMVNAAAGFVKVNKALRFRNRAGDRPYLHFR